MKRNNSEQKRIPILSDLDLIKRLGLDALALFDEKKCVDFIIRSAIKTLYWQTETSFSVKYNNYTLCFGEDICEIHFSEDDYCERFLRFEFIDKWWCIKDFSDVYFSLLQCVPVSTKCNEQLCLLECMLSGRTIVNYNQTLFME